MIYIQSKDEVSLPHHFDAACALYGAESINSKWKLVSFEEVQSGKWDRIIPHNLFVGSVEFMNEVWKRVNKENVRYPINSNRQEVVMTLEEVLAWKKEWKLPIFIKPLDIKLFTGFVLDDYQYSILDQLPWDTKLITSNPFRCALESEWRVYVHNHQVEYVANYSGDDFYKAPSKEFIHEVIGENKKKGYTGTYTIDVGILEDGGEVVVEFNDMWAIGNYGVPNDLYVRMLTDRYFEIVKKYDYEL